MTEPEEPADRRAEAIERLEKTNNRIFIEMQQIKGLLANRPTRDEVKYRRRIVWVRTTLVLFWVLFVVVQLHDVHIEECGPGRRTERAITALAAEQPVPSDDDLPWVCDVTFPTHAHGSGGWPTTGNLVGLALYIAVSSGSAWLAVAQWNFRPSRPIPEREQDRGSPPPPHR